MDILNLNNCVLMIIDFSGFKTIFISFPMMGNWLFICYITIKALIKKYTFFTKFHDNNVNREAI